MRVNILYCENIYFVQLIPAMNERNKKYAKLRWQIFSIIVHHAFFYEICFPYAMRVHLFIIIQNFDDYIFIIHTLT